MGGEGRERREENLTDKIISYSEEEVDVCSAEGVRQH